MSEEIKQIKMSDFEKENDYFPHVFILPNPGLKYEKVEICGSFTDWKVKIPMRFDNFTSRWFSNQHLRKGKHYYKYMINGTKWVLNEKEPREIDLSGFENNILNI